MVLYYGFTEKVNKNTNYQEEFNNNYNFIS